LNSTYKDFAKTAGDTAAGAQQKLGVQIANLKQAFGEMLLPTIQKVQGFMANQLLPVISGLMEKFKDGTAIQSFITFIGSLLKNLYDFGSALVQIAGPVITNILVPAFLLVGAAIVGVIKTLGKVGTFLKENQGIMVAVSTVIAGAAMGFLIFNAALFAHAAILKVVKTAQMIFTVVQTLMTGGQLAQIASTNALAASMLRLNAIMAANPIGLIVAAIAVLAAAFVVAWNHSETFRKFVIAVGKAGVIAFGYLIEWIGKIAVAMIKVNSGPLRLLLKGLALLKVPGAAAALKGIEGAIDSVGTFFDNAAKSVKGYADNLDGLANKRITLPSMKMPKMPKAEIPKIEMPDISGLDPGNTEATVDEKAKKAAAELAAKISELKSKLKDIVIDYNDFINNDFAAGFIDGGEKAKDTIMKGLDELRKVFDAQQAIFEAQDNTAGIANVKKQWDAINAYVRSRIAEAVKVANELEIVNDKLAEAEKALVAAQQTRAEGAKSIMDALRRPFGQPSEIDKALADGETTVDNIIGMYDRMREAIIKRFDNIEGGQQTALLAMLENDTQKLIDLNVKQKAIVKELELLQKDYDDIKSKQKSFKDSITSSIKSFGSSLADLSKSNADTTIKVIKTSTGLVITQMAQGSTGVSTIIDKLKSSLQTIRDFTTNIQALLTAGYNKEYVRTLLEAGPEAAGATAALLAKSGSDTMATVNDLYTSINASSETFGTSMSATFYDNSVAMAKALVDGTESKRQDILNQMAKIAQGIQDALAPLKDASTKLGEDIIQRTIDALNKEKSRLIDLANSIAAEIAAAMARAAAAIGVGGVTGSITLNPGGSGGSGGSTGDKPSLDAQKELDDANAALADAMKELDKSTTDLSKVLDGLSGTTTKTISGTKTVTAKSGDTVSAIAKAAGASLASVLALNPKLTEQDKYKDGNMIWAGTTIKVPTKAPTIASSSGGAFTDAQNTARIAAQNNTFEKGAFNITVPASTAPADLEPVMTRALLNALSAR
jgi:LysM repeat protein